MSLNENTPGNLINICRCFSLIMCKCFIFHLYNYLKNKINEIKSAVYTNNQKRRQ